ncbi:dual specificity protein phosphatase [Solidesulfovibrio sp.]|uniref:protein-tyrosine phosphatase family protein n=1 Tax=Solidesulfovibrio sp. TaxID=2910990 RepID=UPI002B21B2ED|nr:dual specificity protein phosphatase [Solidesulfovibrio sp.]MEA4855859.1 dual specificity protein phosphatase [Solidesulfovibrio sp.]
MAASDHAYPLTWVTDRLAVGGAPMSYEQLASLKEQGVTAILNLCAEFCDLHDIEAAYGFEVHYLPVQDEEAPDLAALERALEWLDEAVYLGKKVLIHCRHGIGRTGTVLNAYLLRRGLGHKLAARVLRPLRSKPTNFDQWWTIRRYGKKSGRLTIREPRLECGHLVDLSPFLADYAGLVAAARLAARGLPRCGRDHARCCRRPLSLSLIEAVHLGNRVNVGLSSQTRLAVIEEAAKASREWEDLARRYGEGRDHCLSAWSRLCPLSREGACLVFANRPIACVTAGMAPQAEAALWESTLEPGLAGLSRQAFLALAGSLSDAALPRFPLPDVVSGRYVSAVFKFLLARENGGGR